MKILGCLGALLLSLINCASGLMPLGVLLAFSGIPRYIIIALGALMLGHPLAMIVIEPIAFFISLFYLDELNSMGLVVFWLCSIWRIAFHIMIGMACFPTKKRRF